MRNRLLVLCSCVAVLALPSWLLAAPTADELLVKMTERIKDVKTYQADIKTAVTSPQGAMNGTSHVVMENTSKDGKTVEKSCSTSKMTMTQGEQTMTMEVKSVNDGEFIWNETKLPGGMTQVMKTKPNATMGGPIRETNPMKQIEEFRKMFVLKTTGEDTIDGLKVYVLEGAFNPDYLKTNPQAEQVRAMLAKVKMFVGQDDLVVHRMIGFSDQGQQTLQVDTSNVKVNEKVDSALFAYTPPPGARVMDMTKPMPGMPGMPPPGDDN